MKRLTSLLGNSQKLDGGAMFGSVPKALWSQWVSVDDKNRIDLVCRALLVQETKRNILLETGIGYFFEPKLRDRYGVVEDHHLLLDSLKKVGVSHEDIDVVVLSHLHFDHAGGLLTEWRAEKEYELLFPKAIYLVGEVAWERAQHPHYRDRTSFVPPLNELLKNSKRLQIVKGDHHDLLGKDYRFHLSFGHTPGMLLVEIKMPKGPVVFAADLIPGTPWVHLPITMGYDRAPELLIEEKKKLLDYLIERQGRLFYTHDVKTALSNIIKENDRYRSVNELREMQQLTM